MHIYEWSLFPASTPVATRGSLTKTFLRNVMSHEVSDWRIIYDTEEEALPKKTEAQHPIRFSLQIGMCQVRCTGSCQVLHTLPPPKNLINFGEYIAFP